MKFRVGRIEIDSYISNCKCWDCCRPEIFLLGNEGFGFQLFYWQFAAYQLLKGE